MGKTFVEVVSKLSVPSLVSHLNFEFKDGVDKKSVPHMHNNMIARRMPEFKCIITERINK